VWSLRKLYNYLLHLIKIYCFTTQNSKTTSSLEEYVDHTVSLSYPTEAAHSNANNNSAIVLKSVTRTPEIRHQLTYLQNGPRPIFNNTCCNLITLNRNKPNSRHVVRSRVPTAISSPVLVLFPLF
jgi:recombination DNA repair RAD52 pathway protein